MKLPHTEVKLYPKVKSQTGLSSFRISCKRTLTNCSKIFDCILAHDILISKLEAYGFIHEALNVMQNYLSGKTH